MRVLWLTNMWPDAKRPWYGSFVHSQAQSLEAAGVELDVLYVPGYEARRRYAQGAIEVLRRARRNRYDLVHAHYGHSGVLARLQWQAPVLISYCGDDLLGSPTDDGSKLTRRSIALARSFAELSRFVAATITKSEEMELRLPAASRVRNHVIPNGVDLSRFEPIARDIAREQLGWDLSRRQLLFVGDPSSPRKNLKVARAAADELLRRGIEAELKVAWGVEPVLLPTWMAAADALVFPSLFEGSPNTVKEAMAMELPIVSAPVGDVAERLRGVAGTFVCERDPVQFAECLEQALGFERAPQAREAALEVSIGRIAERIVSLYREVAGLPAPAGGDAARPERVAADRDDAPVA